jgi:hypothetical protein
VRRLNQEPLLRVQCPFRRQKSEEQRTTEDTEIAEWVEFRLDTLLCFLCPLWLLSCSAGLGTNFGYAAPRKRTVHGAEGVVNTHR